MYESWKFAGFLQKNLKKLQKKVDFFRNGVYTDVTWSKMVAKWSKMEEVSHDDR
jgi:hypothetical protein